MEASNTTQPGLENWQRRFFLIWGAQLFSLLGSNLVGFALIWWLTKTTGSATVLATASLVGLIPQVVLGPFAGTLVDRWNRRVIMIVADSVIALATIGIAVLFWLGHIQIWQIYVLMFIRSVAGGFHFPAMQASTSLMVPNAHLARIQGLNSMVGGGMSIISAPLGALLIELLPMQGVLAIDAITAFIAITPLFFVSVPQPERSSPVQPASADQPAAARSTVWQEFRAGLRYIFGWKGLLYIAVMAVIINFLLTPAFSLLPILVTKHFNGGALQLAWMNSAYGGGVVLGGLLLSVWGGFRKRMHTSLVGILGMAAGVTLIGLASEHGYYLALAGGFVAAFFNPIANGPLFAVVQGAVAPDMQGRVFTLIGSAASFMSPVGLMIAGPMADALGVQTWFLMGAVAMVLLGTAAFFIPAIIDFEKGHPKEAVPAAPSQTATAD